VRKQAKKQMSKNQQLFKDAIADAKALREVAVANAKAALEESFMPRIQSMFEKRIMDDEKLDEMDSELEEKVTYEGDKDNLIDPLDENEDLDLEELFNSLSEDDEMDFSDDEDFESETMMEEDDLEEDYDLEEILRELEEESNEINEEEDDMMEGDDDELNENSMFEKATGTEDISEVTVDELRDMIQDAIKAVMGGEEGSAGEEEEMSMDMGGEEGGEDFNIDFDSEEGEEEGGEKEEKEEKPAKKKSKKDELDELFALYERKKKEVELDERRRYKGEKADDLNEKYDKKANAPYGAGSGKAKPGAPYGASGDKKSGQNGAYKNKLSMKLNEMEDLEEDWNSASMSLSPDQLAMLPAYVGGLLASMVAGGAALANKDQIAGAVKKAIEKLKGSKMSNPAGEDIAEAVKVIKTLRGQLNEVNLLNAKLIYVNRIFKANQLTESQKVNVVNSFDKAQTLNEAKNIFEVLKNTVKTTKVAPKTALRENKSFASSVIGGKTAKPSIINADDTITRMQKLAGIIKN
jgi:hypothetical protein